MLPSAGNEIKIAPSILSADFGHLADEVREVLRGGADLIHVDVMDGEFVPNLSIGVPVVKSLRRAFPDALLDVHLMVMRPGRYVQAFADAGADLLMFHIEADNAVEIENALTDTKRRGVRVGLSVKPDTPVRSLSPWLNKLDMALIMTVEPGFGGQSFLMNQLPKIHELRSMIETENLSCDLGVDGGIDEKTAPLVIEAGANILVAGSAIFGQKDRLEAMTRLRCAKQLSA